MDQARNHRRYLAVFLAISVVAGLAYRAVDRGIASLVCQHDRPAGQFLAYCSAPSFGDFEHGAFYYDLEPAAVAGLRAADVLFFGSSRAQFALSTGALRQYFSARGVRPYLLGFGYNESGAFPLSVLRKQKIKPKAVVVLADPFFQNRTTGLVRSNQWLHWRAVPELYEYLQKLAFIATQPAICRAFAALCQPPAQGIDRSVADGSWTPVGFSFAKIYPIGPASTVLTAAMAAPDQAFAEAFLRAAGVPRSCLVLSAAPSSAVNADAYVTEMGRLLGVRVSLPRLDGLESFDANHLSPASAERWSAALLADIGEQLVDCARSAHGG